MMMVSPVSHEEVFLKEYFLLVRIRSIDDPLSLKHVFVFIKFVRLLLSKKFVSIVLPDSKLNHP